MEDSLLPAIPRRTPVDRSHASHMEKQIASSVVRDSLLSLSTERGTRPHGLPPQIIPPRRPQAVRPKIHRCCPAVLDAGFLLRTKPNQCRGASPPRRRAAAPLPGRLAPQLPSPPPRLTRATPCPDSCDLLPWAPTVFQVKGIPGNITGDIHDDITDEVRTAQHTGSLPHTSCLRCPQPRPPLPIPPPAGRTCAYCRRGSRPPK